MSHVLVYCMLCARMGGIERAGGVAHGATLKNETEYVQVWHYAHHYLLCYLWLVILLLTVRYITHS